MGQFTDVMALICILITMAMLLVENIVEEWKEKKDNKNKNTEE